MLSVRTYSAVWYCAVLRRCLLCCHVMCCARGLSGLAAGTQNASEGDYVQDAGETADLVEEADRCQQPQGSCSGLLDHPDLHEMGSQADDQIVTSHQMPSFVEENRTHDHQWHSALVMHPGDLADEPPQLHGTTSQQRHHDRIAEAQQAHTAHRGFHRALQGQNLPQPSGYQSMNGHGSFDSSKVLGHFRRTGVSVKAVADPAGCVDPVPLVTVGFSTSFS